MTTTSPPLCNCCGLPVAAGNLADCPRCGYPLGRDKEEQYLRSFLPGLQRVAAYGGQRMTVGQLIQHYRQRLNYLYQFKHFSKPSASVALTGIPAQPPVPAIQTAREAELAGNSGVPTGVPSASAPPVPQIVRPVQASPVVPVHVAPVQQVPREPQRMFSLKTFFADQTINIVASLGAFLILVGSLSFVATSTDLLLSFLVILVVHALFGLTGAVSYRFPSFRIVAAIYTAIFALQVPLVGFACYRLIAGHLIELSPPTLVAIAALYAAIVYGALAVYQQFRLFGYLAVVSLALADLACSSALHLNYWWWPSVFMLLAFPALFFVTLLSRGARSVGGTLAILREPVRILMYACIGIGATGVLATFLFSLQAGFSHAWQDERFSVVCMLLLLLVWVALFAWRTGHTTLWLLEPYLFLAFVAACSYSFLLDQAGYALAFTGVALLYHGLVRLATGRIRAVQGMSRHLETIALVLVGLVPVIIEPGLLWQLLVQAYAPSSFHYHMNNLFIHIGVLLVGFALTISVITGHTRARRAPDAAQTAWCWLLLLSGFIFSCLYSIVVLTAAATPVWSFLVLTLGLSGLTVAVRRLLSSAWANPLDILILCMAALTLVLSLAQGPQRIMLLLLGFAVLLYAVLVYQQRVRWLFLPLVFAVLALFPLSLEHRVLFALSVLLPFVVAGMYHFFRRQAPRFQIAGQPRSYGPLFWVWPLIAICLLYEVFFAAQEMQTSVSTFQQWSGLAVSWALELVVFSCVWYLAAVLTRVKSWLLIMLAFALVALLSPLNPFWTLLWLASVLALLALCVSRLGGRDWALPLYMIAVFAVIMMGRAGYAQGQMLATSWALLLFALFIYGIGVAERSIPVKQALLWIAAACAAWSLLYAGLLGDLYRPPVVALLCAGSGMGIGLLRFRVPAFAQGAGRLKLLLYALPCYATALFAAVFTGVYGSLHGINHPFYAAIPVALLIYALVAYGVLLFECQPRGLGLVAAFAIWAILLSAQTTAYYVAGIGFVLALLGLLCSRLIKHGLPVAQQGGTGYAFTKPTWGWPWYAGAFVAALELGLWQFLPVAHSLEVMQFLDYALLAFAALAYIIAVSEEMPGWSWVGTVLALCSLYDVAVQGDLPRLFSLALLATLCGVLISMLGRFVPAPLFWVGKRRPVEYALPLYAVALAAALLTALPVSASWNVNYPFYAALPVALFVYALMAYGVLLLEQRPSWLWLVAGLALWSTLLLPFTASCTGYAYATLACTTRAYMTTYCLCAMVLGSAALGLLASRFARMITKVPVGLAGWRAKFAWNWPWYLVMLVTIGTTMLWNEYAGMLLPNSLVLSVLCFFVILMVAVMLLERVPELLLLAVGLAVWTIMHTHWLFWQQMGACSLLCALIFIALFIWRLLPPATRALSPERLYPALASCGLALVVLDIVGHGGLSDGGMLAQTGAGTLCLLAVLLFWYGRMQVAGTIRQRCMYSAGLLLSLVCSWELLAFQQRDLSLLVLAPASYLIVVAPFLLRDQALPERYRLGQLCSIVGALLLLLPTLWSSFSHSNLTPTLFLAVEALILFLLGVSTHMRFFVLSGAALVIVSAIHLLFLPTLGIPIFLALTLAGIVLLALATVLILVRSRLASLWVELE